MQCVEALASGNREGHAVAGVVALVGVKQFLAGDAAQGFEISGGEVSGRVCGSVNLTPHLGDTPMVVEDVLGMLRPDRL